MSEPMSSLFERYRPKAWGDVLAQDKVCGAVRRIAERSGLGGRAYWLTGQSGTGKTTIARLIAQEVACAWHVREFDATELSAERLREVVDDTHHYGMGRKSGKAVIINEAHGLRADIIRRLLVTLEDIPAHVVWIFTTTNDGQEKLFDGQIDASPLLSRCVELPLARRGLAAAFAERAREIATAEGLNGRALPSYVELVRKCRNNLRRVLQKIEAGAMLP